MNEIKKNLKHSKSEKKILKKKDIIKNLSEKTGFSINFSKKLIDDLIEILLKYKRRSI